MAVLKCTSKGLDIPEDVSFTDFVFQGINHHAQKTAFIDDATGEQITYGSLEEKVNRLACALYERGLRKRDVVCLYADKSIVGIIAVFAIIKLGAIMTPCRPSHSARELAIQLNDSQSKVIIADNNLIETVIEAKAITPSIQKIYSIGHVNDYECLEEMVDNCKHETKVPDLELNTKEHVALIIYSSGTTGLPKGVMLTHYALVAATTIYCDPYTKITDGEVYFHLAPPFHVAGLTIMAVYLHAKKTLVLYTPLALVPFLKKAKEYKVNDFPMFPYHLTQLSKMPQEEIGQLGIDFAEMRLISGGSVIGAGITKEVLSKTGAKAFLQGYGSTECIGAGTIDVEDNFVAGSVGMVLPHTQIKIMDINTGATLGTNEQGEVCVKGPQIMKGYFNNPEATKQALDTDGWLHTGDLGYYDESSHLFIVDRLKDVIKYNTMQVSPAEIEEVIYTHPAVKTVCVVGVNDDSAGEVPLACVIVKDGYTVSEQEIVEIVNKNVADYKRLRGGVKFMKEFPLTSMGKIMRKELKNIVMKETK